VDDDVTSARGFLVSKREVVLLYRGVGTTRIWTSGTIGPSFHDQCARLSKHLPAPILTPVLDGRGLVADWVQGVIMYDLRLDQRISTIRLLIGHLAVSIRSTSRPDRGDFVGDILTVGNRTNEHRAMFSELANMPAVSTLRRLPLALQHGDLGQGNIVVRTDGSPTLIDWTPMTLGVRPFWSDAALLVAVDGHRPLLEGAFDAELAVLWAAAGLPAPEVRHLRELMLAAAPLFFAMVTFTQDEQGRLKSLMPNRSDRRISKPEKVRRAIAALPYTDSSPAS
jgi:hypothetical protein